MPICIGPEEELEKVKEEWRERKRKWKKLSIPDQLIVEASVIAIIFIMIILLLMAYAGIKAVLDSIFTGNQVSFVLFVLSFILLPIVLGLVAIMAKLMKIVDDKFKS